MCIWWGAVDILASIYCVVNLPKGTIFLVEKRSTAPEVGFVSEIVFFTHTKISLRG